MINPVSITGFFMSADSQPDLQGFIKQTERAVTGVAEFLDGNTHPVAPTNAIFPRPEPSPQETSNQDNASEPNEESDTDEIQDAWLATLDLKTTELKKCLDELTSRLSTISQNVQNLEADARIKHAEADGKITDNALRKAMADKTFTFMEIWCSFIGVLILVYFCANKGAPPTEFMLALLGTCTISIIGLVGFIVSGLFRSSTNGVSKPEKK